MPETPSDNRPLRICMLTYRGNPYCGGQGVYIKHLSHALGKLGHQVDVVAGPPYPHLKNGARLHRLPSLDLYNPEALFRTPKPRELSDPINLLEWLGVSSMGFPEPLTFGMRAARFLKQTNADYDVVHDNQSLSYGIWRISKHRPLVATIHHPMTVDRQLAVKAQPSFFKKFQQLRWYSFIGMQKRVAPTLQRIITMSQCVKGDLGKNYGIPHDHIDVIPNGIDTDSFYPLADVSRIPFRLVTTSSADTPLKGLQHLLEAVSKLSLKYPALHLVVVGIPNNKGTTKKLIYRLGIEDRVRFTGHITQAAFVHLYAEAWTAIVPSIYEGFGLPAGEAMACAVPVISTTGGALPEVLGQTGLLVPPADTDALVKAIETVCDNPDLAYCLGRSGRQRILDHFSWEQAAKKTAATYRKVIHDYRKA